MEKVNQQLEDGDISFEDYIALVVDQLKLEGLTDSQIDDAVRAIRKKLELQYLELEES